MSSHAIEQTEKMGNKNNRGKGQKPSFASETKSATSSPTSSIRPKSILKSKNLAETTAAPILNVKEEVIVATKGGTGFGEVCQTLEIKNKEKEVPQNLRFRSYATNTLDTKNFQPPGYIPKKVQPVAKADVLSAKSPAFVPGVPQGKETQQPAAASASRAQQTAVNKPGHDGAFGSTRQSKVAPNPSAGFGNFQDLVKEFPPYNPAHHAKHLSDGSNLTSPSASAISAATSRTTTNSSPYKTREGVIVRVDRTKKDFVIRANGLSRNRVHVDEFMMPNGNLILQPHPGFNPADVLGEIAEKNEADKEHFWYNNHVQIVVDLRGLLAVTVTDNKGDAKGKGKEVVAVSPPTVIDQISKLGKDFYKYAVNITVSIIFPPTRDGSVAPRPQNISDKHVKWVYPDYSIAANTTGFAIMQQLVAKLDKCVSLQYLEVIIHNLNACSTLPFTLEQLYYALPFYDLHFEEWELKWQGNYMSEPVDVGHFPTILLDKQRNKWLWAKKKAAREAEATARKEQERIENMVFVTKSIAPEWQKVALPEPFPKAPKKDFQYKEGL